MKTLLITAALLTAQPAFAGNLVAEMPAEAEVVLAEQPGSMGGSGAWLVPLLAIGLVALAVSQDDDEPDDDTPVPCDDDPDCYTPTPCIE